MRKALFSVLISASLLCTTAFASVGDDQVTSQKIKEADGTSAQNTNSGSGVKTGHIQNGAVTGAKIAADTVTNGNIASGAVTDDKISGQISASKINSTGLNADTVDGVHAAGFAPATHAHAQSDVTGLAESLAGKADLSHNHDSVYQKKYDHVVVVAKSGGDFTDPISAVESITDATSDNRYLVKIMPGVYSLSYWMYLKDYVDIEGSGQQNTVLTSWPIQFAYTGNATLSNMGVRGMIRLYSPTTNIVLKDISLDTETSSIEGTLSAGCSVKLENISLKGTMSFGADPTANVTMNNVKVVASSSYPMNGVGLNISGGNYEITNSSFEVSGGNRVDAVSVADAVMKISNSTIIARDGTNLTYGLTPTAGGPQWFVEARNCEFRTSSSQGYVIGVNANYGTAFVANSLIENGYWGATKLINCFNENYDPIQ